MTTKRVRHLAVPVVAEYTLQVLVLAVNTLLVSRAGDIALAAVGISNPIIYLFLAVFAAISVGATVLVAQAHGAGIRKRVNAVARQSVVWSLLLAIPLSVVAWALTPTLIGLFGDDPEVQSAAISYLHVITATSSVMLLSFLCGGVLRGAGDGRTPLYAAVLANFASLVASWILIEGHFGVPAYGIVGAAWGSVIGRAVGLAFVLAMLFTGRAAVSLRGRDGWKPQPGTGLQIFRLGIPAGVEQFVNESGFAVLTALVATLGAAALAANHIAFTALEVWFLTSLALSVTATALSGQSFGAGRPDEAMVAARIIRRWALIWNLVGMLVMVVGARPILSVFSHDADVIDQGVVVMVVVGLTLPLWGLSLVTTGPLRGSGDTRSPMYRSTVATWTSVLLAWIAVTYLDAGMGWIWGTYLVTLPPVIWGNWRAFRRRVETPREGPLPVTNMALAAD
ncbi:MAG TPA: MATE family efflux transporter [Thermomicrobiales bacterium]|nr:MATE family efflux transporter [Thermomicrobiales bacterium]